MVAWRLTVGPGLRWCAHQPHARQAKHTSEMHRHVRTALTLGMVMTASTYRVLRSEGFTICTHRRYAHGFAS